MEWGRHNRHSTEKAIARFLAKVIKEQNGCWIWVGAKGGGGRYGSVAIAGRVLLAHRGSWFLFRGEPGDMNVCHTCDNGMCVNPDHLFLGTQRDNVHDMETKKRSNHPRCEKHGRAKLTAEQVAIIRLRGSESVSSLAMEFNVAQPSIRRILNGTGWVTK